MQVSIKKTSADSILPTYACKGDAGFDCYAHPKDGKEVLLMPGERALVPLGFSLAVPEGYELQLRPRSGLALKQGLSLANAVGTVDSGYRNEVGAILINLGASMITIKRGERICQGVLNAFTTAEFLEVESLDETERGTGGFGHSGIN